MLIVDMPMPVKEWNCLDCKAMCADLMRGHYCGITKKTINTLKNMRARPDWCPIKGELPEQHGDLIDRDVLRKCGMMYRGGIDEDGLIYVPLRDVMKSISNAPTVIAAERKDDDKTIL